MRFTYISFWKKFLDVFLSLFLIFVFLPVYCLLYLVSSVDTKSSGFFVQKRIGQYGTLFNILKFKTIHPKTRNISNVGKFLRKSKLDELPQLINILKGEMSFVGPRPDIEGYYDKLVGDDRRVLLLKPGLTSEASLKYRNEEQILAQQKDPLQFNDEVLFPDKVKMNLEYFDKVSFKEDFAIVLKTFLKV